MLSDINPPSAGFISLVTTDLIPFFFSIRMGWLELGAALPWLRTFVTSRLLNDGLGEGLVIVIGHTWKFTWRFPRIW